MSTAHRTHPVCMYIYFALITIDQDHKIVALRIFDWGAMRSARRDGCPHRTKSSHTQPHTTTTRTHQHTTIEHTHTHAHKLSDDRADKQRARSHTLASSRARSEQLTEKPMRARSIAPCNLTARRSYTHMSIYMFIKHLKL